MHNFNLLLTFLVVFSSHALALPKLQKVGIIPVRFEDETAEWKGLDKGKNSLNRAFYDSVRESKRFRVLNDDLVKQLWSTSSGRKELASKHEMDAFVSLSASRRGDVVTMTTRLLSPDMKVYLQETENLDASALENNEVEKISNSTKNLVYRNLNRLPSDVFVIATEGKYVTFAGGENQGIKVGDQYEVQKSAVESSHPANGSWLTFRTQKVGDVKIIDSKAQTSIGEIVNEVTAIQPGDGIKVADISTRTQFKNKIVPTVAAGKEEPIVVDPIYAKGMEPPKKVKPTPTEPAAQAKTQPEMTPNQYSKPGQKEKVDVPLVAAKEAQEPVQSSTPPQETPEVSDEGRSGIDISSITNNMADRYSIIAGLRTWKVSGPGFSYSAAMPMWILNNAMVEFHKPLSLTAHVKYGAGLLLGSAYFGYEIYGKPYYELVIDSLPKFLDRLRFGGYAKFEGKSTKDDQFGGYDASKIGLSARAAGQVAKGTLPENLNWEAGFDMPILATGRIGYNGSMKNISGYSGLNMHLEGLTEAKEGAMNWGASLDYGTEVYKAKDRIQESTTKLMGIINMKW